MRHLQSQFDIYFRCDSMLFKKFSLDFKGIDIR